MFQTFAIGRTLKTFVVFRKFHFLITGILLLNLTAPNAAGSEDSIDKALTAIEQRNDTYWKNFEIRVNRCRLARDGDRWNLDERNNVLVACAQLTFELAGLQLAAAKGLREQHGKNYKEIKELLSDEIKALLAEIRNHTRDGSITDVNIKSAVDEVQAKVEDVWERQNSNHNARKQWFDYMAGKIRTIIPDE